MEQGDIHIGFGIMGGANQPLAHAQFVSNFVDYKMNIQSALEAPRFTVAGNNLSCDIVIESRIKPDVLQALRSKGHNLIVREEYTSRMGRGQVVLHNSKTRMNFAASDPRADGVAEPEPVSMP
jgi:gamma-glutamyltranspeptidase/glutathione hydrolase